MDKNIFLEDLKKEIERRKDKLIQHLDEKNAEMICLFSNSNMQYFTVGTFIETERPVCLLFFKNGTMKIFVPLLEKEHAEKILMGVEEVLTYPEYPGQVHPMILLAEVIKKMVGNKKIILDMDGYSEICGYRGPKLSRLLSNEVELDGNIIEKMKTIKSEFDLKMIRECAKWGDYAHILLQQRTKKGLTEGEITKDIQRDSMKLLIEKWGFCSDFGFSAYARAGYRGQIGAYSYFPHAKIHMNKLSSRDVLVSGASANIFGYFSELERVMFVEEPSKEAAEFYQHALNIRQIALDHILPGYPMSRVDKAVLSYFEKYDLMGYWRHHTGHAIGFNFHEAPYFDVGDDTIMAPGMVMTVEPGIYVKNLGGFRLSDTIFINEKGYEIITNYDVEIESLIC